MGYETEQTVFAAKKGGLTMKKKIFAALAAAAMLCGFLAAPASAAADYQMGDVNMDGVVDLTDAMIVLQDYVEVTIGFKSQLSAEQSVLGNVDGEVFVLQSEDQPEPVEIPADVVDAQYILMYYCSNLTGENISLSDVTGNSATYQQALADFKEHYTTTENGVEKKR